MLAASCQDTDEFAQLDSRKAQVMFSVAMDSQMARSRTTWGDYTPSLKGDEYDNHIELNQLVVKIEAGGSPLYVKDIVKWKDGEANEYKFVGIVEDVDTETTLTNVKISVFANMGTDGKKETFEQDAKNIPMWGMTTMTELKLAPGTRNDDLEKKPIYLLRAMAKLEVSLNSEMLGEYALTGVTLNKHNPVGNCLPTIPEDIDIKYTTELGLEAVKNVNESGTQSELAFTEAETGKKYIVYLPEVENGTSEADYLNIEVELTAKDAEGNLTESVETGNFDVMDYSDVDNPIAIDIVRNHWYKYTVSGFAAGEVQVNYQTLDWQDVGIEIGGEGFLFLNKDVIEIYNSNIDEDQLKFSSSSPIKSIVLKDIYKHYRNGNILANSDAKAYEKEQGVLEEDFEADGVYAYYMDKFGVLTQLSNAEGSEEAAVLNSINASVVPVDDKGLNGGITINSPFINHETLGDSHYDTPRYLEFVVTNNQDLQATFRVVQYPPVVITNEEGYFSYREDFRVDDLPISYYKDHFTANTLGETIPKDNGEPTHLLNPRAPFFTCADFYPYHVHEWNPNTERVVLNPTVDKVGDMKVCGECGDYVGFDETMHGLMEREYLRVDEYKGSPKSEVFHRSVVKYDNGNPAGSPAPYLSYGPVFEREVEVEDVDPESGEVVGKKKMKKYYRRHYTGNSFLFYFSLYVQEKLHNGRAVINSMAPHSNPPKYEKWVSWGAVTTEGYKTKNNDGNHRMYHIRTTMTSDEYVIGWPKMVTEGGHTYTAEGEANSKMVSPSFMVASQLGKTFVPLDRGQYDVPEEDGMYLLAKRHCEQYAEATYKDLNNNNKYDSGEPVTHYTDWRLPTDAELKVVINYQRNSRAMDKVLDGESYFCTSKDSNPQNYNSGTVLTYLSATLDEWTEKSYHIRCVRDVKSGQNGEVRYYNK